MESDSVESDSMESDSVESYSMESDSVESDSVESYSMESDSVESDFCRSDSQEFNWQFNKSYFAVFCSSRCFSKIRITLRNRNFNRKIETYFFRGS